MEQVKLDRPTWWSAVQQITDGPEELSIRLASCTKQVMNCEQAINGIFFFIAGGTGSCLPVMAAGRNLDIHSWLMAMGMQEHAPAFSKYSRMEVRYLQLFQYKDHLSHYHDCQYKVYI